MPNMTNNLLSVNQFTPNNNCYFVFTNDYFFVKDSNTGRILFQGRSRDGFYPFHLNLHHTNKSNSCPSVLFTSGISSNVWHKRLSHSGQHTLRQLSKLLQINGSLPTTKICIACQMGKRSKLPFTSSFSTYFAPLCSFTTYSLEHLGFVFF